MTFIKPQFLAFYKPWKPQSSPRTPVGAALTTTKLPRRRRGSSTDSSQACSPLPTPARPHPAGSPLVTQTPGRAGPARPGRKRGSSQWEPPTTEPRRPGPDEGKGNEENPPGLAAPPVPLSIGNDDTTLLRVVPVHRHLGPAGPAPDPVTAVTSHPARARPPPGARETEVRGQRGGSEAALVGLMAGGGGGGAL